MTTRGFSTWFRGRSFGVVTIGVSITLLAVAAPRARAETDAGVRPPSALKKMSLEELFDLKVTSVSKAPEPLSQAASAIHVITADDIRRSGATNLAEALRLAPILEAAQANSHDWAITARGFNGAPLASSGLADKLLVLIDGRSVYTPLFGGVFWDVQEVVLEDVDRIEVINGPGGTLWGVNAVNGIINVVTKSAAETQGLFLSGAGGSWLEDQFVARYGGRRGSSLSYRGYAQRADRGDTRLLNGDDAHDEWDWSQGGFRVDWTPGDARTLTLQGDLGRAREGSPTSTRAEAQNVLGRFRQTLGEGSEVSLQMYFDRAWREQPAAGFEDELRTYDLDFQHRFPWGGRNTVLWGGDVRLMQDEVDDRGALLFVPSRRTMRLYGVFLQDEIQLAPSVLKLTLGSKLEHNTFSGYEAQPGARLAWTLDRRQTIWAACSRAVRSPSRIDVDIVTPGLAGNEGFESEKLTAFEIGYRLRPTDRLSISLSGFYNRYVDVRSINAVVSPPPAFEFANDQKAETGGIELSGRAQPLDRWRLRWGYVYLHERLSPTSDRVFPGSDEFEAVDPKAQAFLQSTLDLPRNVELGVVGRCAGTMPATLITPRVPAYLALDVRLACSFRALQIAVVGRNLGDERHAEFGSQLPRSVYGKVTCRI